MKNIVIVKKIFKLSLFLLLIFNSNKINSQTNSSTVTNNTSPSASSTTSGGTSINYQTNSSFSNDLGFGPGIICRTPSFNINSSVANSDSTNFSALGDSGTRGDQISASMGIVIPFGSGTMDSCKDLAKQISVDKQISSQLSMIRACASLQKEGIKVDPEKFPLLSKCIIEVGQGELLTSKIDKKEKSQQDLNLNQKVKKLKIPSLLED
tara:strand:+ start:1646 stop:2272 length:627 start_codon:yes stop_codon:yes gene_type:complete